MAGWRHQQAIECPARGITAAVGLRRALQVDRCLLEAVEVGLVGLQAGIDQEHLAPQTDIGGQPGGQAPGDRRGPGSSRPGDGDEAPGPSVAPGRVAVTGQPKVVNPTDGHGVDTDRVGEVAFGHRLGQVGGQAQRRRPDGIVGTAEQDDRTPGGVGPAYELPIQAHGPMVDQCRREGSPGAQPGQQVDPAVADQELVARAPGGHEAFGHVGPRSAGCQTEEYVAAGGHGGDTTGEVPAPPEERDAGGVRCWSGDRKYTRVTEMEAEATSGDEPVDPSANPTWLPTWLGVGDVATRLGVVPKTVYRMIDNGSLTAFRIGRVIRIKESDLRSYEDSCEIQPGDLAHLHEG